jgi:hypothetical protein
MDKVTYILGAGFSAPLGLPVMSNFLIKSKDLYFQDTEKYSHFKSVFNTIKELSVCKNYYDTNLFNIEEILSILEVRSFIEGEKLKDDFIKYIIDTINCYTPEINPYGEQFPGNWNDFVFGGKEIQRKYGYFIGSLLGVKFWRKKENYIDDLIGNSYWVKGGNNKDVGYSVLSLNYDMVLEGYCQFMNSNYRKDDNISFSDEIVSEWHKPSLFKLHGCSGDGTIVPPTWAKGTHRDIIPIWKNAYQALVDSTHIRFIGYSLPLSDSYVKYLLKSSVVNAPHLKQIDVICLDKDASVKKRFDDFIQYDYYRFKNADIVEYLNEVHELSKRNILSSEAPVILNKLEIAHERFMSK